MDVADDGPQPVRVTLRGVDQQVADLGRQVASGQVVLDPEAGDRLRTALRRQIEDVADWVDRARGLSRPIPLGRNPVGWAMAGKFERRADGDQVSLMIALERYRAVLASVLVAVETAIRGYEDSDHDAALRLRGLGGSEGGR